MVTATDDWDGEKKTYTLKLTQSMPATPGQEELASLLYRLVAYSDVRVDQSAWPQNDNGELFPFSGNDHDLCGCPIDCSSNVKDLVIHPPPP